MDMEGMGLDMGMEDMGWDMDMVDTTVVIIPIMRLTIVQQSVKLAMESDMDMEGIIHITLDITATGVMVAMGVITDMTGDF